MNGVTIIEEHLCRVVEMPSLIRFGIFLSLLIIGALAMYRWMYKNSAKDKRIQILVWCCSTALIVMYIVTWVLQISNYNKTHMEYTVTVDDNVSFNDFYEKYEILSVNENEYRVIEK